MSASMHSSIVADVNGALIVWTDRNDFVDHAKVNNCLAAWYHIFIVIYATILGKHGPDFMWLVTLNFIGEVCVEHDAVLRGKYT